MNSLHDCVLEYVAMRRALGFKMKKYEGWLLDFAAFMERRRAVRVTVRLALKWAQQTRSGDQNYRAARLRAARGFARYRSLIDPRTEIPPPDLLPTQRCRLRPYLYSESEIRRLLAASLQPRRSATSIPRWSRFTFFGLLSVTGLRVSEAHNLDLNDVDLDQGVSTIRNSKFGKSRLVPLHPLTCAALRNYLQRRNEFFEGRPIVPFFVSRYGTRMGHRTLYKTFIILSRKLGLRGSQDRQGPRLHDLRHRMAAEVLLRCYRPGADPERRLPGTVHISWTHQPQLHLLVLASESLSHEPGDHATSTSLGELAMKPSVPSFSALLQRFFTQRLMQQKRVSAHTISSYRDTFRLLLRFAHKRLHISPDHLIPTP